MTTTVRNARDKILQSASIRAEPVTLPPTVVVPPSQLGAGSLPGTVTGSDGSTIVHQGNFRAQTVVADQVDTRGLAIKNEAGQIIFSAGVNLDAGRVSGLGALASQSVVNLATQAVGRLDARTQVTFLGDLAYASVVAAEKIVAGSFSGQKFTGGEFIGTKFTGINMKTENLDVNSVNATDELKAFNVNATGTSKITNLIVDKNIFAPAGRLDCLDVKATNDVECVNLYATSSASLPNDTFVNGHLLATTMRATGQITAGSFNTSGAIGGNSLSVTNGLVAGSVDTGSLYIGGTGSAEAWNVKARWDLTTQNLIVNSSIAGSAFDGFIKRGTRYTSVLFNDGTGDRRVDITF